MSINDIPSYIKFNADKDNPRFITDGMNEFERTTKRLGDLFVAIVALIVFSPLFLICYILTRREDGGPAIFKQSVSVASDGLSPSISSGVCVWMPRKMVPQLLRSRA